MYFKSEKDFLQELDGKVYAVSDKNGNYLCDIIEDDYFKLSDLGILVDMGSDLNCCDLDVDSDVILTIDLGENGYVDFKEKFGLYIEIKGKKRMFPISNLSIDYELDSLVLKSSKYEMETSFVFMDGIAIEIKSLDECIPVPNPVILIYPHKKEVLNNVRMREAIANYRGHPWDGDFYSIALLYGEERKIQNR